MKKLNLLLIGIFLVSIVSVVGIEVIQPSIFTVDGGLLGIISSRTTLERCEEYRQELMPTEACVAPCIMITQEIFDCEALSDRPGDIETDEIGKYGFFRDNDDDCVNIEKGVEGIQDDMEDYKCMYDDTYIPDPCADECTLGETKVEEDNVLFAQTTFLVTNGGQQMTLLVIYLQMVNVK